MLTTLDRNSNQILSPLKENERIKTLEASTSNDLTLQKCTDAVISNGIPFENGFC